MIGEKIHRFASKLWKFNRSITGQGLRDTLNEIKKIVPHLKIKSVPSGTKVFDWTVPNEWMVNEAFIITPEGKKICDFNENNLHLLGYSHPFSGSISLAELEKHLFSNENLPSAIPFVTSYYEASWGFCISQNERNMLSSGQYEVVVDTKLFPGVLNYGEVILPGQSEREIFLSTYVCHPSMANNELSGPSVLTYILEWLSSKPNRHYTYRAVFVPETIGSITYLSKHYKKLKKMLKLVSILRV